MLTPKALWSVPVLVVTLAAAAGVMLAIQRYPAVPGVVRAAVGGGVFALAGSTTMRVAAKGLVYRPWKNSKV